MILLKITISFFSALDWDDVEKTIIASNEDDLCSGAKEAMKYAKDGSNEYFKKVYSEGYREILDMSEGYHITNRDA